MALKNGNIGPCITLQLLAVGDQSQVHLGKDARCGKRVAIKIIQSHHKEIIDPNSKRVSFHRRIGASQVLF